MAIHACHLFIPVMHIGFKIAVRTGIFAMDPSAVATCAGGVHGRHFDEPVTGQKAAPGVLRSTDMALSAAGMADEAVPVHGRTENAMDFGVSFAGAFSDCRFHWFEGEMQAGCRRCHNLFVAVAADCRRVRIGRITDDALMHGAPVVIVGVAAMALLAGDPAVIGFQKSGFYVYFLV